MMKWLQAFWKLFKRFSAKEKVTIEDNLQKVISEEPIQTVNNQQEDFVKPPLMHKEQDKALTQVAIDSSAINLKDNDAKGPLIRQKREKVVIQVGLDFGTSTTKIVYSQLGKRLSRAVNFNHELPTYPNYCLPSLAAIDSSGKLLLGIEAARFLVSSPWDSGLQRFKVIVAGNCNESFFDAVTCEKFTNYCNSYCLDSTFTAERLTAIYLAHAMHISRKYIKNLPEYRGVETDIAYNICIPIDHIQNNKIKSVFEYILAWAERIENDWQFNDVENYDILSASYKLENGAGNPDTRVFTVPESVAQIASYLTSLQRQEKLHAVIDFGAGTTDISIFNFTEITHESASYWFAAKNIPKGTINIEQGLTVLLANEKKVSTCNCVDITNCLKDLSSAIYKTNCSKNLIEMINYVQSELEGFRTSKEYTETWASAYKRYKDMAKWRKVDVFVCGGGAILPNLKDVFSIPWWDNIDTKYTVRDLLRPDDFEPGEANAHFQRMAVAYGLARPIPEFDKFVLPDDVPEYKLTKPKIREIDHEEIYSEK